MSPRDADAMPATAVLSIPQKAAHITVESARRWHVRSAPQAAPSRALTAVFVTLATMEQSVLRWVRARSTAVVALPSPARMRRPVSVCQAVAPVRQATTVPSWHQSTPHSTAVSVRRVKLVATRAGARHVWNVLLAGPTTMKIRRRPAACAMPDSTAPPRLIWDLVTRAKRVNMELTRAPVRLASA
jgi:hypothetical protein